MDWLTVWVTGTGIGITPGDGSTFTMTMKAVLGERGYNQDE
jgi:hypothetical protein